jgi:uncharacterized membrane protein
VQPARRISAGDTAFAKFFVSAVFLGFVVALTVLLISATKRLVSRPDDLTGIVFDIIRALAGIGMGLMVVWLCARLKRVALSDTSLHVSNFAREIVVPLSDVESVDQVSGIAYRVVVRFARATPFGRQINFSPIGLREVRPHPILAELRTAVTGAKSA